MDTVTLAMPDADDLTWGVPQETKDIETTVAGIRADKVKAEAAEKAARLKGACVQWVDAGIASLSGIWQ